MTAPFLTFSAVLTFFKSFLNGIGYNLCRKRPLYIFSELNGHALILAKNILEKEKDSKLKPMIVFTDVIFGENETGYELTTEARKIKALCLKTDIAHLNIISKKQDTEIFLIGEDESENVRQASIITGALNQSVKKLNVKIFVFASKESSRYTLDSLDCTNLLNQDTVSQNKANGFKLRRINCIRQLVWRTVPDMDIVGKSRDGVISVMIAGIGSYGLEFFKMLVWFCQIDGCKLEINLFDKTPKSEYGGLESVIARQCPELIEKNGTEYDIMMFDGIDFTTDGFAKLLEGSGSVSERLRRTDIAIVCSGNDDLNIEMSVYLRELFDKCNHVVMAKDKETDIENEVPDIYSVVYDSRKYGSVSGGSKAEFLKNHQEQKYHIRFIGSVDEQYSYDNIYSAEKEADAFIYHNKWSKTAEKTNEERLKFDRFEFYRQSSMATAVHQGYLRGAGIYGRIECLCGRNDDMCECENCVRRKRMEHARWMAYMRSEGYSYRKERFDRAKLHNDLIDWGELSKSEHSKD